MNKLKQVFNEARKTVTAWVAVALVFVAAVDNNIEVIYGALPQIAHDFLPQTHATSTILHWVMTVLGIGVAVARVRRLVWPPKPPEAPK